MFKKFRNFVAVCVLSYALIIAGVGFEAHREAAFFPTEEVVTAVVATKTPANAAHHIEIIVPPYHEVIGCTATAIGPHALLSAAHCDRGTDVFVVDGKKMKVVKKIYDGYDHMIVIVDGTFSDVLPVVQRPARAKELVHMWGFPGARKDVVYSPGYLESVNVAEGMEVFSLASFPGDSGSGILDADENIIGVASVADASAEAGSFPLSFSAEQLAEATH